MTDLLKRIDDWLPYADEESGILASLLRDCRAEIESLRQALAEPVEPVAVVFTEDAYPVDELKAILDKYRGVK